MRDMSKYLVYAVDIKRRNDKSKISYVSFGDVCSKIEFNVITKCNVFLMWSYNN